MRVKVELAQITATVLERWARLNGLSLEEHLSALIREDVRVVVKSLDVPEFDEVFALHSVAVVVAPTGAGWRNVALREETAQRVRQTMVQKYADKPKPPLWVYIEELLWPILEAEESLRTYGPFLEKFVIEKERIYIKDNKLGGIAELTFNGDGLFCNLDNRDNCVHIGFAWSIPEVYKIMEAHGMRMPKVQKT